MTTGLKAEKLYDHWLYINQDKDSTGYKVGLSKIIKDMPGFSEHPSTELYYSTWKQALHRYNYLRRKLIKENEEVQNG